MTVYVDRGFRQDTGLSDPQPEFRCEYALDLDRPPDFYTLTPSDRHIKVRVGLKTISLLHDALFEVSNQTARASKPAPQNEGKT